MGIGVGIEILVDADACPVKEEVYRVARRYGLPVYIVANSGMMIPQDPLIRRVMVGSGFDAADNWIAERAGPNSIVVTADIPLASRCLKSGALVIGTSGRPFDSASIGNALAMRSLMDTLRATGEITGGAAPFSRADRSRFLSALDEAVNRLRRR